MMKMAMAMMMMTVVVVVMMMMMMTITINRKYINIERSDNYVQSKWDVTTKLIPVAAAATVSKSFGK
jgi:hypothetical protein